MPPPETHDGVPEIVLDPNLLDPETPPAATAAVVAHEMGHAIDNGFEFDFHPDGTPNVPAQEDHFIIYKDGLFWLCQYLTWLSVEPGNPWYPDLCALCRLYSEGRAASKKLARPAGHPPIGPCLACGSCGS